MGYCPLARAQLFGKYPLFGELSEKLKKTEAQLFLRWALQERFITIPKSANVSRIQENCELYDFEISQEDMTRIEQLVDREQISLAAGALKLSWAEIKDRDVPYTRSFFKKST